MTPVDGQLCLHVEGTQSTLCHFSRLHSPKPIYRSLPSFKTHALLFICSKKRADKPILSSYLSPNTDEEKAEKEQAADTQGPCRGTFNAWYQAPSSLLRIDYRRQLTQIQSSFSVLQENPKRKDLGFLFPVTN